jgi:hypothetical protein
MVGVLAATGTGCGADDNGGSMKVSGNCGLGENTIAVDRVLPTSVLESLIDEGDYKAVGGLIVRNDKLPAAYDGECAVQEESSGQDALRLGLVNRSDARYAEAQKLLASGDVDGFKKVDDSSYVIPDGSNGARAVAILPDRLVILRVLQPGKGVDAMKKAGPAVTKVAQRVQDIG